LGEMLNMTTWKTDEMDGIGSGLCSVVAGLGNDDIKRYDP